LETKKQAFDAYDAAAQTGEKQEPSGTPVFDIDVMKKFDIVDEAHKLKMVKIFLEDSSDNLDALRNCLEAGDAEGVTLQAHSIKSAAAYIGGEALRAAAFEIEKAGKANDLGGVTRLLPELDIEFVRLKAVLEKLFSTDGQGGNSNDEF
jgi:HPt (histidine-containing phosphotransfer) domain-containing protein